MFIRVCLHSQTETPMRLHSFDTPRASIALASKPRFPLNVPGTDSLEDMSLKAN